MFWVTIVFPVAPWLVFLSIRSCSEYKQDAIKRNIPEYSLSLSRFLSLSPYLLVSICRALSHCLSVSICHSLSLWLSLSLSLSLRRIQAGRNQKEYSRIFALFLSLFLSNFSPFLSLSGLYVFFYLSPSHSASICPSRSLSVFFLSKRNFVILVL